MQLLTKNVNDYITKKVIRMLANTGYAFGSVHMKK